MLPEDTVSPEEVLTFSQEDRYAAVWLRVKRYYESRLETLRRQNDADLDDISTARLRGRIMEIKALLDLDTPDPAIRDTDA